MKVENKIVKTNAKEKGATMVEYALVVLLIAILAIAALRLLGQRVSNQYVVTADQLQVGSN